MQDFVHVHIYAAHQQKKKVKLLQHKNSSVLSLSVCFADEIIEYCSFHQ
jgi:hypothetical protein